MAPIASLGRVLKSWHPAAPGASGSIEVETLYPPKLPLERGQFSVATFNLAHGRGRGLSQFLLTAAQLRRNLGDAAAILQTEPVDFLALQEVETQGFIHGHLHQSREIAQAAGFGWLAQGHHVQGKRVAYGTALLARHPLEDAESHVFPHSGTTLAKGLVMALGQIHGRSLRFVSVHLDFLHERIRKRQLEHLAHLLAERLPLPLILMGDFNCGFRNGGALHDTAERLGLQIWRPHEAMNTFPRFGRRLDWILASQELEFLDCRNWEELRSDHIAVRADFRFRDR